MTTAEIIAALAAAVALLSSAAAWTAIALNRRGVRDTIAAQVNIAARNSRANVVSANRQKWIDAIRDDVAQFVAVRSRIEALTYAGSETPQGADGLLKEDRELHGQLAMLKARIRMRLNHGEEEHLLLLQALNRLEEERSLINESALDGISRTIFKAEWDRLKLEASGIRPFVKEAKPVE